MKFGNNAMNIREYILSFVYISFDQGGVTLRTSVTLPLKD